MPCATKSESLRLVSRRTSMSGHFAWNRWMRGRSHFAAKAGLTVTVSVTWMPPTFRLSRPRLRRSSPALMSGSARCAVAVGTRRERPVVARWNKGAANHSSRVRTSCPTAAAVTFNSSAAPEKLPCPALASKARSAWRWTGDLMRRFTFLADRSATKAAASSRFDRCDHGTSGLGSSTNPSRFGILTALSDFASIVALAGTMPFMLRM